MKNLFATLFLGVVLISCNAEEGNHSCYDASLVHDGPCPTDCPGVEGCDGNTYCNECEASRQGIRVK